MDKMWIIWHIFTGKRSRCGWCWGEWELKCVRVAKKRCRPLRWWSSLCGIMRHTNGVITRWMSMLDCFRVGHMHGNSGRIINYLWWGLCEYHTQEKGAIHWTVQTVAASNALCVRANTHEGPKFLVVTDANHNFVSKVTADYACLFPAHSEHSL